MTYITLPLTENQVDALLALLETITYDEMKRLDLLHFAAPLNTLYDNVCNKLDCDTSKGK